jgi:hypothetical protein
MKKWLIFAVIAAMFAMVMFPACGGDAEESDGAASDVVVTFDDPAAPTAALISWNGDASYEYGVYYQVIDYLGSITPVVFIDRGQNLYTYDVESAGATTLNTNQDGWQFYYDSTAFANGVKTDSAAVNTTNTEEVVRFGVAALNPGGFQVQEAIDTLIVWGPQVKLAPAP